MKILRVVSIERNETVLDRDTEIDKEISGNFNMSYDLLIHKEINQQVSMQLYTIPHKKTLQIPKRSVNTYIDN